MALFNDAIVDLKQVTELEDYELVINDSSIVLLENCLENKIILKATDVVAKTIIEKALL